MLRNFFIKAIRFYQRVISPLKAPCCRFYPSCSQYTIEALNKHGLLKGGAMSVYRIIRCNPYCKGGFDPV